MRIDQDTIIKIAAKINVHPVHIRIFLSNNKSLPLELIESEYSKYINQNPKPFVKWVGGKRQLLKQFRDLDLYPPYGFNPNTGTYFEPFIGGGALFFDLLPNKAELSDLNLELVTTYNVVKRNVENLITKLKWHQVHNNKEYFLKIRSLDFRSLSDVCVAARFIYLNRTCFNGMFRVNKSGQFNVPYGDNKNPLICDSDNLRKASEAMKNTRIICQDYKKILDRAKKGDFIYFDPPYYPVNKTSSFTNYTKEGFFEKEQVELRDLFLKLHNRGCFVMLSNSDTPFINDIYSKINSKIQIHKLYAGRAINSKGTGRGKVREVLVTNY